MGGGIRMPHGMARYGNVATADLARMFSEMGVRTGVDVRRLIEAGKQVRDLLGLKESFSHAASGGTKADVLERGRVADPAP